VSAGFWKESELYELYEPSEAAPVQLGERPWRYKLPLHLQNALGRRMCARERESVGHVHAQWANECMC